MDTERLLPDTHPDAMRHTYRAIMQLQAAGAMTELDAYELVHVCIELGRMGYVLTADESDWQPPPAAQATTRAG